MSGSTVALSSVALSSVALSSSTTATVAGLVVLAGALLLGAAARPSVAGRSPVPATARPHSPPPSSSSPPLARRRLLRSLGAIAAVLLAVGAAAVGGPLVVGVVVIVAVAVRRRRPHRVALARRRAIEAALPDAIELLVLCVHAGRSPTQAVVELASRALAAVLDGFVAVELQLHRGRGLADALGALPATLGPPAGELAAVMATADREGLPLAPVLDRLAADARAARRRQGEAAARRLPVRLSFPLVGCTLPAFVLLAIAPAVLGAVSTLRGTAP